jgi:ParB family transcriptional regulator, chromosome partitioning protein
MRLPSSSVTKRSAPQKAETIRSQGVLSPLLVRPTSERSFEIVFGARRYRAAQMAEAATVPVRIKDMSDAEVLEAQLIENLQRRDVNPALRRIVENFAFDVVFGFSYLCSP